MNSTRRGCELGRYGFQRRRSLACSTGCIISGGVMFDWIEICLALVTTALLICAFIPQLRAYRSLLLGTSVLVVITASYPRRGNSLGEYLFDPTTGSTHLSSELFGIAWWILGAWLLKTLLALILRRTIFPNDYQPHARRLFADLASGLVYVVAFVGIMDTVLKQPISALLATSGVLAIVLGLALQNTLADVFSGLAINIDRPFGAGDWITMNDNVEGQIIEINWRATRIKTSSNDMIVIPNSVIAKAIVTNHRRLNDSHVCTLSLKLDGTVSPAHVIEALQEAASASPGVAPGSTPVAHACGFVDALIAYELCFAIDDFINTPGVRSEVIKRVIEVLQNKGIPIGAQAMDVRIIRHGATTAVSAEVQCSVTNRRSGERTDTPI
jgi:small-conductance mechanosensitive channel